MPSASVPWACGDANTPIRGGGVMAARANESHGFSLKPRRAGEIEHHNVARVSALRDVREGAGASRSAAAGRAGAWLAGAAASESRPGRPGFRGRSPRFDHAAPTGRARRHRHRARCPRRAFAGDPRPSPPCRRRPLGEGRGGVPRPVEGLGSRSMPAGWRSALGGRRSAVGVRCLVLGAWCLVLGAWCLVLGVWRLALGAWRLAPCVWSPVASVQVSGMGGLMLRPSGGAWVPSAPGRALLLCGACSFACRRRFEVSDVPRRVRDAPAAPQ